MGDPKLPRCAVELRPKSELGITQWGGLGGKHHFSFAAYQRPDRLEWGTLRAVNHYRLAAGEKRAPTFHAGFEILTLVTSGRLRRTGSHAARKPLCPGSAELISTGIGANLGTEAVGEEAADYIEIWIKSAAAQKRSRRQYRSAVSKGFDNPIASGPSFPVQALSWRTDAQVHWAVMRAGENADRRLEEGDCAYLVVLAGEIDGNGIVAGEQDALAISGPGLLSLCSGGPCEFLLIRTSKQG